MKGTKYLSELVNIDELTIDKLNIIKAPTGCGKTYFAINTIGNKTWDTNHEALYLIDTTNGKEQILDSYGTVKATKAWLDEMKLGKHMMSFRDNEDTVFPGGMSNSIYFKPDKNLVVMTYAAFGYFISEDPVFATRFKYIICDELPSLLKFQNYSKKPNCHSVAKIALEQAVHNSSTYVVALSATPNTLKEGMKVECYDIIFDMSDLIQYETKKTIQYIDLNALLNKLDITKTGIIYTTSVRYMKEIDTLVKALGFNSIAIWSINNFQHPMNEEQFAARNSIIKDRTIPKAYNMLIINASSETSLKIKSEVDFMIIHGGNEDTQIQVRGRVNHDLETLYIHGDVESDLRVPDAFIGIKLFAEDKDELIRVLSIKKNGREIKWPSIKKMISDSGYIVQEGRDNNKRYAIITEDN